MAGDLSQKERSGATKLVGSDPDGNETEFADVEIIAGQRRLLVETVQQPGFSVTEIFAFLNNASCTLTVGGTVTVGDIVTLNIKGQSPAYTVQAGDDIYAIRDGLVAVATVNAVLSNPSTGFDLIAINSPDPLTAIILPLIVITPKEFAEDSDYPFSITLSSGATVTVTNDCNGVLVRDFKKVLGEQDRDDPRLVRLGIAGEVGSRTKAENPVDVVVRKNIAGGGSPVIFVDANVDDLYSEEESLLALTELKFAFLNVFIGSGENRSEHIVYQGFFRDKVQNFVGNGVDNPLTVSLDFQAVPEVSKISVVVNGNSFTFDPGISPQNDEFSVDNDAGGPGTADPFQRKAKIIIKAAGSPLTGTDNIVITYDAVRRKVAMLGQVDSSFQAIKEAPIRMTRDPQQFLIATVLNKGNNVATTILNINGFFDK